MLLILPQSDWHGFTPYPGARALCGQNVVTAPGPDQAAIRWYAWATRDRPQTVARFYRSADTSSTAENGGRRRRRGESVLTIASTSESRPGCGTEPDSTERTVIIASTRSARQ